MAAAALPWKEVFHLSRLHTLNVTSLAFSPDQTLLATASADGALCLIDISTRSPVAILNMVQPGYVTQIQWCTPSLLVIGKHDGAVQFVDVNQSKPFTQYSQVLPEIKGVPVTRLAYTTDGPTLAVAYECLVEIYQSKLMTSGEIIWECIGSFTVDPSDGGIVSSLSFIATTPWRLLITHHISGLSFWKGGDDFERQTLDFVAGDANYNPSISRLVLRSPYGYIYLMDLQDSAPWFTTTLTMQGPVESDKYLSLPVHYLGDETLVAGTTLGFVLLKHLSTGVEQRIETVDKGIVAAIAVTDSMIAVGSGGIGEPGVVSVYASSESPAWKKKASPKKRVAQIFEPTLIRNYFKRRAMLRRSMEQTSPRVQLGRSITVCALLVLVVSVVIADDLESTVPPSWWWWIPAVMKYHIMLQLRLVFDTFKLYTFDKPTDYFEEVGRNLARHACKSVAGLGKSIVSKEHCKF